MLLTAQNAVTFASPHIPTPLFQKRRTTLKTYAQHYLAAGFNPKTGRIENMLMHLLRLSLSSPSTGIKHVFSSKNTAIPYIFILFSDNSALIGAATKPNTYCANISVQHVQLAPIVFSATKHLAFPLDTPDMEEELTRQIQHAWDVCQTLPRLCAPWEAGESTCTAPWIIGSAAPRTSHSSTETFGLPTIQRLLLAGTQGLATSRRRLTWRKDSPKSPSVLLSGPMLEDNGDINFNHIVAQISHTNYSYLPCNELSEWMRAVMQRLDIHGLHPHQTIGHAHNHKNQPASRKRESCFIAKVYAPSNQSAHDLMEMHSVFDAANSALNATAGAAS